MPRLIINRLNLCLDNSNFNFSIMAENAEDPLCTICRENIRGAEAEEWVTPCNHSFHVPCILKNIQSEHEKCPNCREDIHQAFMEEFLIYGGELLEQEPQGDQKEVYALAFRGMKHANGVCKDFIYVYKKNGYCNLDESLPLTLVNQQEKILKYFQDNGYPTEKGFKIGRGYYENVDKMIQEANIDEAI